MSELPKEPTPEQVADLMKALEDAGKGFQDAMAWARTSFVIGKSFMHYRKGEHEDAALAVDGLPIEQRHMVYRWAAWLVGLGE